jgi:hypothetical protein
VKRKTKRYLSIKRYGKGQSYLLMRGDVFVVSMVDSKLLSGMINTGGICFK